MTTYLKEYSHLGSAYVTQSLKNMGNLYVSFLKSTKAVRGPDYSPATVLSEEKDKLVTENWRRRDNKYQRIIPKPHAHLHSMQKTSSKFQNNRWKTERGVAPTRYTLTIHFDSISCIKKDKFTKQKKLEKIIKVLYPNHMHIFIPCKKHLQNFKTIKRKLYTLSIHFDNI